MFCYLAFIHNIQNTVTPKFCRNKKRNVWTKKVHFHLNPVTRNSLLGKKRNKKTTTTKKKKKKKRFCAEYLDIQRIEWRIWEIPEMYAFCQNRDLYPKQKNNKQWFSA